MATFGSLKWLTRFLEETPGDSEVGGKSRQVPNACWSRVKPSPPPSPELRMWSDEMGLKLGLERPDGRVLGGEMVTAGMDPYSQRYGGHQFG